MFLVQNLGGVRVKISWVKVRTWVRVKTSFDLKNGLEVKVEDEK